ncbi:MAG TPA: sulfur carrier protein ThiS [Solirubrobacteraceae bacterium]|jgi:sulfur carrier protein
MIYLNGDINDNGAGRTVVDVLVQLDLAPDARGVAVAVNGEVVPRVSWGTFTIPEGACVEVLTAMQGG